MQNHNAAGIRGHYHKSSDCFKYPEKSLRKIFLPKKILESNISNPKKSFDHPRHLKSGVPPPPPWVPRISLQAFVGFGMPRGPFLESLVNLSGPISDFCEKCFLKEVNLVSFEY